MCFGGGGTTTSVQTQNLPEWVSKGGEENFGIAKNLSERPWQNYTGQRIADWAGPTTRAFNMAENAAGNWRQGMSRSSEALGHVLAGAPTLGNIDDITSRDVNAATIGGVKDVVSRDLPDMDLSRYINPHVAATLNPVLRELRRNGEISRDRLSARASGGAWGGARHGVIEAEQMKNEDQAISDATARAYGDAWTQGSQLAQSDRTAALQAALANQGKDFNVGSFNAGQTNQVGLANQAASIEAQKATMANRLAAAELATRAAATMGNQAAQSQEMGMKDVGAQLDIGERMRAIDQARLDMAHNDYLDQWRYPIEMLNLRSASLSGSPYARSVTTTGPGSNQAAQGVGMLATLAALGGKNGFNWWGG